MRRLRLGLVPLVVMVMLCMGLLSCDRQTKRRAFDAQAMLDEADLLLHLREREKAQDKVAAALVKIDKALARVPEDPDYLLLSARAHLSAFTAKNATLMQMAPQRPRSLVRLPKPDDYIDYSLHILAARSNLRDMLRLGKTLDDEHRAVAHMMLGTSMRLRLSTLDEAETEYGIAIRLYEGLLRGLKQEHSKLKPKTFEILRIRNQLRAIRMAQVEVGLLAEQWGPSLGHLEKIMGGKDLQYFGVRFSTLERRINEIEAQIRLNFKELQGSREERLEKSIAERKKTQLLISKRKELGSLNPLEGQLLQTEIDLTEAINSLQYRIICYYNLEQEDSFSEAMRILGSHYPELKNKLIEALKS